MDALNALNAAINTVNGFLWSKFLIIVLLGLGVYFTIRTGFVQIRCLREMTRCLLEGVGVKSEGKEISSFQAFCISTASRVGVGNIAGVAIAIVLGGPGAIFWMWVVAVIGSATGFVESTLAQIYKIPKEGGAFHGGPAYYIANVLHMPKLAKLFSLLLMVTFSLVYNSLQANTITLSLEASLGWDRAIVGGIISVLIAIIICGGAQVVAKVAERLVPVMAGLYLLITAVVLVLNLDKVPTVFGLILADAFSPQAAVAGGFGAVVMNGIKRGLFSNEAGEGYVDTLIICSASAFLVLVSGQYEIGGKLTGIALVQKCLSSEVGTWAVYFVALMITLFAFSSLVGNYYYGEININVLSEHKAALYFLRAFTVAMVMMGSVAPLPLVWDMADLFMAFLATTNLYAIARLFPRAKVALDDYLTQLRAGKDPVFDPRILPDLEGVHAWGVEDKK